MILMIFSLRGALEKRNEVRVALKCILGENWGENPICVLKQSVFVFNIKVLVGFQGGEILLTCINIAGIMGEKIRLNKDLEAIYLEVVDATSGSNIVQG